jgi:hypothetical protein
MLFPMALVLLLPPPSALPRKSSPGFEDFPQRWISLPLLPVVGPFNRFWYSAPFGYVRLFSEWTGMTWIKSFISDLGI